MIAKGTNNGLTVCNMMKRRGITKAKVAVENFEVLGKTEKYLPHYSLALHINT